MTLNTKGIPSYGRKVLHQCTASILASFIVQDF
jgi:hypothetical protein